MKSLLLCITAAWGAGTAYTDAAAPVITLGLADAVRHSHEEPLELLRSRGLMRFGTSLTLKSENELIRRLKEMQPAQKSLQNGTRDLRAAENRIDELQRQRDQLLQRRITLNRDLQKAQTDRENNQIVGALGEANDRIRLIDGEIATVRKQLEPRRDALARARTEYLRLTGELRALVATTEKGYVGLTFDAEAQSAVQQLSAADDKEYKIAPSRSYLAAVKQLEKYESVIESDSTPLEQRNSVYRVEVLLNDNLTVSMVFDTGAGYVTLPAEVAAKLGLRPDDNDPNITVIIGDGSRVQAKAMRLRSMRIGKCVAQDVDCLVMPDTLPNAPMVLGGTFLKHFTYKIDPTTHRLTLARIDAGPATKDAPTKKTRPPKSRPNARGNG